MIVHTKTMREEMMMNKNHNTSQSYTFETPRIGHVIKQIAPPPSPLPPVENDRLTRMTLRH